MKSEMMTCLITSMLFNQTDNKTSVWGFSFVAYSRGFNSSGFY